jgi:hypothetical protein
VLIGALKHRGQNAEPAFHEISSQVGGGDRYSKSHPISMIAMSQTIRVEIVLKR